MLGAAAGDADRAGLLREAVQFLRDALRFFGNGRLSLNAAPGVLP